MACQEAHFGARCPPAPGAPSLTLAFRGSGAGPRERLDCSATPHLPRGAKGPALMGTRWAGLSSALASPRTSPPGEECLEPGLPPSQPPVPASRSSSRPISKRSKDGSPGCLGRQEDSPETLPEVKRGWLYQQRLGGYR